ncbi:hypothetical protein HNQ69_000653 [Bartonella callosciuri]|uniref:Protein-disulfide reductase n=1 Tax=Bartonella callosciuri TaxID=686223 RepID=A0A840NW77_9HYPH|nr:hypothetical protein [Bartonella callosciuri]MBB5073532.1 hypothetical protein [Bartonella callosciuri]
MVKLFRNYVLSIFTAVAFFLSQVVNANANHLKNNPQHENIPVSVMEQRENKIINIAALYVPGLSYGVENNSVAQGKIEKVFEPITLGTFSVGIAAGYATSMIGMLLGLIISAIVSYFKK